MCVLKILTPLVLLFAVSACSTATIPEKAGPAAAATSATATIAASTAPVPTTAMSRPSTAPATTTAAAEHLPPLFLHLPGIGGKRNLDLYMVDGIAQGGFKGEIKIFDWTAGDPGLRALLALNRDKAQAKILARQLTDRFDRDPDSPINLSCHSGGGGIAVWALEDLPDRVKIRTLLMLSPAVSPLYDLSRALTHVTNKAYVFSSLGDELVLGFGCRNLGTIDGVKTDAAGKVGFTEPPNGDDGQYRKLIALPYNPDWIHLDNHGDHVGAMTHRFARVVLAPLVMFDKVPATQPTVKHL